MKRKYLLIVLLITLSVLSVLNLFHKGYPMTHDGDVHLLRLTNFYQSIEEGNSIPRWAGNVNFGYGQPVFEFFYPFPYYMASLLHVLGFTFADGLKLLLISGMILSGIAMYLWLSEMFSEEAGFIGGVLYVFAPFRFVDIYVRGDIGENLAFVFIPLILWCIYKIEKKPTVLWSILGAVFLALLILTHNVVSLMTLPFIIFYAVFCFLHHGKRKLFGGYIFWMIVIGFLLSAFFWMPGLFEGKYTLRDIVTKGEYKERFVSITSLFYGTWGYGGEGKDMFTVQVGILQWCALLGSMLSLPVIYYKKHKSLLFIISTVLYMILGIFFMLPQSDGIWSRIILLQNFQFPWRFLTVTTLSAAILGAYLAQYIPKKYTGVILTIFVLCVLFINKDYMHAKGFWNRPDSYFVGIKNAPADTGESSPIWSVRFMEHEFHKPLEVISGMATIHQLKRTTTQHIYRVMVTKQSRFLENTLYFPGWEVTANTTDLALQFQDERYRGLITYSLAPGSYTITTKFIDTKFRRVADMISLASVIVVILFVAVYAMKQKMYKKTSPVTAHAKRT